MSREWVDADLPNPAEDGINNAQRESRLKQLRRACREAVRTQVLPYLEAEVQRLGGGAPAGRHCFGPTFTASKRKQ